MDSGILKTLSTLPKWNGRYWSNVYSAVLSFRVAAVSGFTIFWVGNRADMRWWWRWRRRFPGSGLRRIPWESRRVWMNPWLRYNEFVLMMLTHTDSIIEFIMKNNDLLTEGRFGRKYFAYLASVTWTKIVEFLVVWGRAQTVTIIVLFFYILIFWERVAESSIAGKCWETNKKP